MKVVFDETNSETRLESRGEVLAVLPLLYTFKAVDERLKVIGFRRHSSWKKAKHFRGYWAFARKLE